MNHIEQGIRDCAANFLWSEWCKRPRPSRAQAYHNAIATMRAATKAHWPYGPAIDTLEDAAWLLECRATKV